MKLYQQIYRSLSFSKTYQFITQILKIVQTDKQNLGFLSFIQRSQIFALIIILIAKKQHIEEYQILYCLNMQNNHPITITSQNSEKSNRLHYLAHLVSKQHKVQIYENIEKIKSNHQQATYQHLKRENLSNMLTNTNYNNHYHNQDQILCRKVKTQQNQIRVYKIYEQNKKYTRRQANRITFGPDDFTTVLPINKHIKQNPQLSYQDSQNQILSKGQAVKIKLPSQQHSRGKNKNAKVTNALLKQIGMSERQLGKMKQSVLNYELQKFIKKKGNQYLQEMKQKNKRLTKNQKLQTDQIECISPKHQKQKQQLMQKQHSKANNISNTKSQNSLSNLNTNLNTYGYNKSGSNSKKTILSQAAAKSLDNKKTNLHKPYKQKIKQELKYNILNEKQQMLGKIVFDKVQDFFKLDQRKADYYQKVKCERNIDQAWVEYLRTKVDRADLFLKNR